MKYHIVPTPKRMPSEINSELRGQANELNREMVGLVKKIGKRDENTYNELFHLFESTSLARLMRLLCNPIDTDEIIIHAEGYPFMIGPSIAGGQYSLTPFQLASYLKKNLLPEHPIIINILACNSATNFMGSNFSRDLSRALTYCFDCRNISVMGYTGYVSVKSNGKFAVSSVLGHSVKGSHAHLDDAKTIYESGELTHQGRQLISDLSHFGFEWAHEYISQMRTEREFIDAAIQRQKKILPRKGNHSIFISPTDYHTSDTTACESMHNAPTIS